MLRAAQSPFEEKSQTHSTKKDAWFLVASNQQQLKLDMSIYFHTKCETFFTFYVSALEKWNVPKICKKQTNKQKPADHIKYTFKIFTIGENYNTCLKQGGKKAIMPFKQIASMKKKG